MTGKNVCIALLVALIWAGAIIAQKVALAHGSVYTWNLLRVALAFPLIFVFPRPPKNLLHYFLCGFFIFAVYPIFFGFGLQTSLTAGLFSFFLQTQVFFVILCGVIILKERPTWYQVTGILISFFGVYLMKSMSSPLDAPLSGVLFLLTGCLFFGIGLVLSKKYAIGKNFSEVTWLTLVAIIPLILTCLVTDGATETYENIIHMSFIVFLCLVFTTFFSIILATYLWLTLLQKVSIAATTPFMLLVPIFSCVLSKIILGENLTGLQVLSGLIIILGVIFAQGLHTQWLTRGTKLKLRNDA